MRILMSTVVLLSLCGLAVGQGAFCLQTPPGLPAGNGQNGAMFDVQATGGTVIIQNFRQSFFTAGVVANMEVYAVTGGGSFVGNENNAGAWTMLATANGITATGPGAADSLGLSLAFMIPAGTTQGFYVTSNNAQTIAYTNGVGTPGTTLVTSDSFITVTEGVGVPYPFGAFFSPRNWNGDICYDPGAGLSASFSATPTSGPAPLAVQFTDLSFTSDPNGIQTWSWTFGDGGTSTAQNPMHTYACPGSYTVALTVTDTANPASTNTMTGLVNPGAPAFSLATSGGGVGDLTITPVPTTCFPSAISGYTLPSLTPPAGPPGSGPFAGIIPDTATFSFLLQPAAPGNIGHFLVTGVTYPNAGPVLFPGGFFSGLTGVTMEGIQILLDGTGHPVLISNVSRITF